jgi:hypothetical protein
MLFIVLMMMFIILMMSNVMPIRTDDYGCRLINKRTGNHNNRGRSNIDRAWNYIYRDWNTDAKI